MTNCCFLCNGADPIGPEDEGEGEEEFACADAPVAVGDVDDTGLEGRSFWITDDDDEDDVDIGDNCDDDVNDDADDICEDRDNLRWWWFLCCF